VQLNRSQIEAVRKTFMPSAWITSHYHDGRLDRRGGRRASELPPPFDHNLLVLLRLAYLTCRPRLLRLNAEVRRQRLKELKRQRQFPSLVHSRALSKGVNRRFPKVAVEVETAKVLHRWGVLRSPALPHRATLCREARALGVSVTDIDLTILLTWADLSGKKNYT